MKKIAIAITGASGSIYAKVLLDKLRLLTDVEFAIVFSDNAKVVWQFELGNEDYTTFTEKCYDAHDYFAPFL